MVAATLNELAVMVGGRVVGDGSIAIKAARPVTEAGSGDITFLDDERYLPALHASPASAVLIRARFEAADRRSTLALVVVDEPRAAFMTLLHHLSKSGVRRAGGVDPRAVVSPTARLGDDVAVGPFATIGDEVEVGDGCTIGAGVHIGARSKLGRDVTLHPNVVLYEDVTLGDRCVAHAGVVLGGDGFGYQTVDGRHAKVPQTGSVIIEEDVEIGANSCVDRGTFGPTRIGAGTKIDNLVQVGHNVRLGRHNILCAGTGVGGSAVAGDYVVMGGQVGVADHMTIGDAARLCAQAGINRDVPAGVTVFGTPAVPLRQRLETHSLSQKLPEMRRELRRLADEVARLTAAASRSADGGETSNAA